MKNKMTAIPKEGKWYLISFDIPVKLNSKRVALRRLLRDFNFYPFQKRIEGGIMNWHFGSQQNDYLLF